MIGILSWDIRAADTTLKVTAGSINIDDQNIPAITADIVVPFDAEVLAALDPRTTNVPRVVLTGTYTVWASQTLAAVSAYAGTGTLAGLSAAWDGLILFDITLQFAAHFNSSAPLGQPDTMSLDLHVREVSYDDWEMSISLASDEALLTDWGAVSLSDETALGENQAGMNLNRVNAWVESALKTVLGRGLDPTVYDDSALSVDWLELYTGAIGNSAWDYMRPFLEDTNLKLRVNPTGRGFTLQRPENSINPPATHSHFFTSEDVISVRHVYSRSGDWYDSAVLYRPASEGISRGHPGGDHSRTYAEDWTGRKPTFSMAQNIVRRTKNRGQFIDIVAPIKLGVFMRDEFSYRFDRFDPVPSEKWIVKAVTYDLVAGTMNIRGEQRY